MLDRIGKLLIPLAGVLLIATSASGATGSANDTTAALQKAVDGNWRSTANKARDVYRHPVDTLQFFGIEPDMTVIELQPGGGWYTEILAPFLYARGHLMETSAPMQGHGKSMPGMGSAFAAKLKADPAVYGHIEKVIPFAPPAQVDLGADNSVDAVLTFRNTHDWLNHSPQTLAAVFTAAFNVLTPGGVFGVTEHRAKPFENAVDSAKALHRIPEDYMIEAGLKAGFRVAGVSEVNANPKDPEDINVHRLPPNLAGPVSEHEKMKAIGESDRMTIKFVKP